MPKNHRERHIAVPIKLLLNAQETLAIDELIESGLFGTTRSQVARRLMDERLVELVQNRSRLQPTKK